MQEQFAATLKIEHVNVAYVFDAEFCHKLQERCRSLWKHVERTWDVSWPIVSGAFAWSKTSKGHTHNSSIPYLVAPIKEGA